MYVNHGFIKPFSTTSIPIKIVEKVEDSIVIKLEVNWCKATQQMKQKNDSKMTNISKDQMHKKVFTLAKKIENSKPDNFNKSNYSNVSEQKSSAMMYESVSFDSAQAQVPKTEIKQSVTDNMKAYRQDQTISPLKYQRQPKIDLPQKQEEIKVRQQVKKPQPVPPSPQKASQKLVQAQSSPKKTKPPIQEKNFLQEESYQNAYPISADNLQVVSEEDEQDHQKQLQQIKSEQLLQRRRIDELKVKNLRLNEKLKSKQIIDVKLLFLMLAGSYLLGGLAQWLIFQ